MNGDGEKEKGRVLQSAFWQHRLVPAKVTKVYLRGN